MTGKRPEEMIGLMRQLMLDEQCVVISPKQEPFRRVERDFLEGIRRVPADINAPAGMNPYSAALGRPGRWVFVWVPE